jgi:hypothetical protein
MTAAQLLERARDALDRDDLTGAYVAVLEAWRAHRADPIAALVHDLEPKLPPRPPIAAMAWSHWTGIESARDPLDVSRQFRFLRRQDEQLRELVFSHHDARFVVTRDAPTELYMELPLHGWERLQRRDFPIPGVSKIRFRRPHNACAACLSATVRDTDLPRVFGCAVELV